MMALLALSAVREAAEPSTPRASKRRRLAREDSGAKENKPVIALAPLGKASVNSLCKARSPLKPLELQMQDNCGAVLPSAPTRSSQCQAETYPLVGRERECGELDRFMQQSLGSGAGNGRCLYVSGGPGTGKTCSVRASINRWSSRVPGTCVLEVNCMDLTQRSVPGVLQRLLDKMGCARVAGRSMQGLAAVVASNLARLGARVVIVVDEIDQLISRGTGKAASGALSLETLFNLPRLPGAPAVGIVAIANAVDLLERTTLLSPSLNCSTLLFEAYNKDQLKNIVVSRIKAVDGGEAALKALGPIKVELRVRQVAKECGDCRQVLALIEEAHFEAKLAVDAEATRRIAAEVALEQGGAAVAPEMVPVPKREARPLNQSNRNDPLQAIQQLPLEQQILIFALATSKLEATKVSYVCSRYKELCRSLKQPDNLGSKGQVNTALSALEQRGLLELRSNRSAGRGRGKLQSMATEATVELSVSCTALRESVVKAVPLLKHYMD